MFLRTVIAILFLFAPLALGEGRLNRDEKRVLEEIAKKAERDPKTQEFAKKMRDLIDNKRAVLNERDLELLQERERELKEEKDEKKSGELKTLYSALTKVPAVHNLAPGQTRFAFAGPNGTMTVPKEGSQAKALKSEGVGSTTSTTSSGGSAGLGGSQQVSTRVRPPVPVTRSPGDTKTARQKARDSIVSMKDASGLKPGEVEGQEKKREGALKLAEELPVPKNTDPIVEEQLRRIRTRRAMETFDPVSIEAVDKTLGIDGKTESVVGMGAAIRGMNYLSELMDSGAAYALSGNHDAASKRYDALEKEAKQVEGTNPELARTIRLQAEALRAAERISKEAEQQFGKLPELLKEAKLDKDAEKLVELEKQIDALNDYLRDETLSSADRLKIEKELTTKVHERSALIDGLMKKAPAGSKLRFALEAIESKYSDALFDLVVERIAQLDLIAEIRAKLIKDGFEGDLNKKVEEIFKERWEKEKEALKEKKKPFVCRQCAGGFPGGLRSAKGCNTNPGQNTGGVTGQKPRHASPPKP